MPVLPLDRTSTSFVFKNETMHCNVGKRGCGYFNFLYIWKEWVRYITFYLALLDIVSDFNTNIIPRVK